MSADMFKENDIRPLDMTKKQDEYRQHDIQYLKDRLDRFVTIDCPVCGCSDSEKLFEKNSFSYVECPECSMVYTNPRPSEDLLGEYYAQSKNHKFFNEYIYPATAETRRQKIFVPRVQNIINKCSQFDIEKESIFEVGPGYGLFLEEMAKTGYFKKVVGVEASDRLCASSREKGFEVYNDSFENLEVQEKFDAVVAFEVLEHIGDPRKFLEKSISILKKPGLLMMTFPNVNGFDIATMGPVSDSVSHTHINYFNEKSISRLLKSVGFEEVDISTPGVMDTDLVRNKILSGKFIPNSFVKDICIDRYDELGGKFQQFLIDNGLSSNMLVVAKK